LVASVVQSLRARGVNPEHNLWKLANAADSDSKKLDFLFQYTRLKVEPPAELKNLDFSKFISWRVILFILPILMIIGTMMYLSSYCYPSNVFLWGDYETYYSDLVTKRRTLWSVVVAAFVIGVIATVFA